MKIYRIENSRGRGPYNPGDGREPSYWYFTMSRAHIREPNKRLPPSIDVIDGFRSGMKFAFLTPEDLDDWFGEFVYDMVKDGFMVVEFEVTSVLVSDSRKQCVFREEDVLSRTIILSQ